MCCAVAGSPSVFSSALFFYIAGCVAVVSLAGTLIGHFPLLANVAARTDDVVSESGGGPPYSVDFL